MNQRLGRIQGTIPSMGLDAILITGKENRRYLSGFTGTSAQLLISADKAFLITDFRYLEQAEKEAPAFEVVTPTGQPDETLAKVIADHKYVNIGFEADHVTFQQFKALEEKLNPALLEPTRDIVEKLREKKDFSELDALKKAVEIADQAFENILGFLKPGLTETEVAVELEYHMKKLGASKMAFDLIVASGNRAALPHGVASEKKIQQGDFIVLDFGAVYAGYHSDMTRTVVMGKASTKQKEIYEIVLEAQLRAIDYIAPGVKCVDVDAVARNYITDKGYGANFGHGLGHSVGLAIHEKPSLAPRDESILEQGMTVTVEPGIYIRDWGGVRIEDIAVVTSQSREILTRSPKKLYEI